MLVGGREYGEPLPSVSTRLMSGSFILNVHDKFLYIQKAMIFKIYFQGDAIDAIPIIQRMLCCLIEFLYTHARLLRNLFCLKRVKLILFPGIV